LRKRSTFAPGGLRWSRNRGAPDYVTAADAFDGSLPFNGSTQLRLAAEGDSRGIGLGVPNFNGGLRLKGDEWGCGQKSKKAALRRPFGIESPYHIDSYPNT
jgi:hypothetical protein